MSETAQAVAPPFLQLGSPEFAAAIAAVEVCRKLFGRSPAVALWRELGLPNIARGPAGDVGGVEVSGARGDPPGSFGEFVTLHLVKERGMRTPPRAVRQKYLSWCEERGFSPVGPKIMSVQLIALGFRRIKSDSIFYELRLLDAPAAAALPPPVRDLSPPDSPPRSHPPGRREGGAALTH